jgi:molybdate transport system ATP-binding protein
VADRTLSVTLSQTAPIPLDLAFSCAPGDVLGIYGPSGSGKTTILRTIAGLHTPSMARVASGTNVWADTRTGLSRPPHERRVGLVFQDYALFPHMTARENVAAALGHRAAAERGPQAMALLERVHLADKRDRRPAELSGGERQRVALARALAREPDVLLLDEPFSAVDRAVRRHLHDLVTRLRRTLDVPLVLVTHDFEDIVRLASHLVILGEGRALASGTVRDVTARADVAWLNEAEGAGVVIDTVVTGLDAERHLADLAFDGGLFVAPDAGLAPEQRVRVRVPARDVILATSVPDGLSLHNTLRAVVDTVTHDDQRRHALVRLRIGREHLLAEVTHDAVGRMGIAPGQQLYGLVKSVSLQVHPLG